MTSTPEAPCLRIVRRFDVPPDQVFDALTEPDAMRVWWGDDTTVDIDLRVGGRWTITRRRDGVEYTATGEYLAVERPWRVRYTYAVPQFSPNSDTITVQIARAGDGCVVTFVQSGEDIANELRELPPGDVSGSEAGWQRGFDSMAAAWAGIPEKTTWERFFDAHAPIYEDNVFTKNTVREVDFLLEELHLPSGGSVLDVGCGTGRHAIELAKRGYAVTGLDLSSEMLSRAAAAAETESVRVEWIRANATHFTLPEPFDAAVCLCEGAFGLLGDRDDPIDQPLSILRNVSRSLKPQARAVFTVLNAAAMLRRYQNRDVVEGRFDPLTMVESSEYPPQEGMPAVAVRERAFVPTELILLFRLAGMSVLDVWGGTAGNWGRRPLDLDEIEIMIVACKTPEPRAAGDAAKPRG